VLRLDSLSAQTLVVKSADEVDDSITHSAPITSIPAPVSIVEAVLEEVRLAVDVCCASEEAELLVSVVPECDIANGATTHEADIPSASDSCSFSCPLEAESSSQARSSSSTDAIAVETSIADVAEDSPRTAKRKDFMRTMRLRQGISDERYAELQLEKQAAAAAPPPTPQPQMTLEDVQRQVAAHRLRHLALDRKMEQKPRKNKQKQSPLE